MILWQTPAKEDKDIIKIDEVRCEVSGLEYDRFEVGRWFLVA